MIPLLFPKQPYHALVKDDKLQVEELNNPVNDSKKAQKLFYDQVNSYRALPSQLRQIFGQLLSPIAEFKAFFGFDEFRLYGGDPPAGTSGAGGCRRRFPPRRVSGNTESVRVMG